MEFAIDAMDATANPLSPSSSPPKERAAEAAGTTPEPRDALSDREIVRIVLDGRSELFEQLVFRYEKAVYHHVRRMVGQTEEAEDLTQDTFVKAYSNLGRYRERWKFKTWLFRIATNAAISALRKRRSVLSLDAPHEGVPLEALPDPHGHSPRAHASASETMRRLRRALGDLPAQARAVFQLRYFEEMDVQEVARAVGRKPGAVAVMLHRTREKLSEILFGESDGAEKKVSR